MAILKIQVPIQFKDWFENVSGLKWKFSQMLWIVLKFQAKRGDNSNFAKKKNKIEWKLKNKESNNKNKINSNQIKTNWHQI